MNWSRSTILLVLTLVALAIAAVSNEQADEFLFHVSTWLIVAAGLYVASQLPKSP